MFETIVNYKTFNSLISDLMDLKIPNKLCLSLKMLKTAVKKNRKAIIEYMQESQFCKFKILKLCFLFLNTR